VQQNARLGRENGHASKIYHTLYLGTAGTSEQATQEDVTHYNQVKDMKCNAKL